MPQRRFGNEGGCGEDMSQNLAYPARASGDSMPCTIWQQQDILARNKNKLPRSMRYELEDALVGLCDAWFDEIKPHLVRNNIKLHVGGSSAGGAKESVPPSPSGPTAAPPPGPPPADDCTHLDPGAADRLRQGASCASSWSRPPAVLSALRGRLPAQHRRPLSPLMLVPQKTTRGAPQIQTRNCEVGKKLELPGTGRKRRRFRAQIQPSSRVPRLCRMQPFGPARL